MLPRLLSPATPFGAVVGVKIDDRRRIVEDRAEEAGLAEAAAVSRTSSLLNFLEHISKFGLTFIDLFLF